MGDVSVRPARVDELDQVGALTVEAYRADGYITGPTTTGYATHLADAHSRIRLAEVLVAVDATGALLGTVTLALPGTPYAEISREGELEFRMLAVSTGARNRGVGEQLVRAVFARARELALPTVVLCTSADMVPAHRLYQRLGFTRLPDRDWSPGPGLSLIAFAADVT